MIEERFNKKFCILSIAVNLILFLLCIAFYNIVFATNDDYRMNLIVSGAYTGEPSDTLVFMKYPIAWMLSSLYKITPLIPWYGICTMLCIFIPSSVIFYYVLRETFRKKYGVIGVIAYVIFFAFAIQKHILLPQFTLTAAFMAVACLVLLWYMPDGRFWLNIAFATLFAAIAFSIRQKVFLMILPFIGLVIVFRIMQDFESRKQRVIRYSIFALSSFIVFLSISIINYANRLPEEYRDFNESRSLVYDFASMVPYETGKAYFDSIGVDETMYYDISARYLDIDDNVTAEMLQKIAEFNENQNAGNAIIKRLGNAFFESFEKLMHPGTIYQSVFALLLAVFTAAIALLKKKRCILAIMFAVMAGMIIEIACLCFILRALDRLTEVLLLTVSVIAFITLLEILPVKKTAFKKMLKFEGDRKKTFACNAVTFVSLVVLASSLLANQNFLTEKSQNQNSINKRLEILNTYALENPESFYFYDAYDFIAASSNVFEVYEERMNTDSLGNWYVNSPDYTERNEKYGFKTSAEGLTNGNLPVYYAAIGNLKRGITLNMKERYNMEPVIIQTIPYSNNTIYLYQFVPSN